MIVVDTGPLYAATDTSDAHHAGCAALFTDPPGRLVVPVSVVVEASFLIERHLGPTAEARFLGSLTPAGLIIEQLGEDDLARMAELVTTYADMPLGAVDASVVAVAERLGATTIISLDQRHLSVVRPRHTTAFTLLPSTKTALRARRAETTAEYNYDLAKVVFSDEVAKLSAWYGDSGTKNRYENACETAASRSGSGIARAGD